MSLNAAALKMLAVKGFTPQEMAEFAELLEGPQTRSKAAERQARYRKRKADNVTDDVTRDVTDYVTCDVTQPPNERDNLTPRRKPSEPKGSSVKKSVEVPDWMPAEEWAAFKEMRHKMRSIPFTEAAERTVIGKIATLKAEGHDPAKLLSKAVERGHRTVFEDETTRAGRAGKVELTAQQLRERAEWFVRHGQPDRANECRQKAIKIEQRAAA